MLLDPRPGHRRFVQNEIPSTPLAGERDRLQKTVRMLNCGASAGATAASRHAVAPSGPHIELITEVRTLFPTNFRRYEIRRGNW